jgi:hypothetical protein
MSHVFISYKREDELRVAQIAHALEAEGLDVWWDRGLPGGESWHTNIETKLRDAGCVVVVWSLNSTSSEGGFVREEARRGLGRNILVPVLIDAVNDLPLGFGEIQALDLTRWRGDRGDAHFQDVVAAVRAKLANRPTPAPRAPTKRIRRRLLWGGISSAALAAGASLSFDAFGLASQVCTMPAGQPGVSDMCGSFGLGGRPKRAERLAWETRTPGSCAVLREHIQQFPNGAFRAQAADLLTARKTSVVETWRPATKTLVLYEPAAEAAVDERAAQSSAIERARVSAERLCRGFGGGTLYEFVSSRPMPERWSCNSTAAGTTCAFDGHAQCELNERQQTEQEECG